MAIFSASAALSILQALATPKARAKAIKFLKDNWKTIGVITVVGYLAFNYWSMGNEIKRLTNANYANEIIITQYESNAVLLEGSIKKQNLYIRELEKFTKQQQDIINGGEAAAAVTAAEYEARIRELINKPQSIITCEDNMEWLLNKSEDMKWTF